MSKSDIKGIYRDQIRDATGRLIFDSEWKPNLIVTSCRILLAAFMHNDQPLGIQSLQVGKGNPDWDKNPPLEPDPDRTDKLEDSTPHEILLKDLTLQYLSELDAVVTGPTNRIQIVATLGPGQPTAATEPPYPLREFGLFGKLKPNGAAFMIDYIRHPLIEKSGLVTLERRVRLIF